MNRKPRRSVLGAGILLLFFCVLLLGVSLGSVPLSFSRISGAFRGTDATARVILFQLRLPRVIGAVLAGIGLSIAGFLLQAVTDNELCAPNIIGVNSGSGFAVMGMLCWFPMLWRWQPAAAFCGALLTSLLVLGVSSAGRRYDQKSMLVLAGVAVSSLFNAGISFLSIRYPDALSSYTAFSVGGFSGITLRQVAVPSIVIAVCFIFSMLLAPKIGLLCLGDEGAAALGIRVRLIRFVSVVLASALCAAVVSYAGLLGFVGLIVPHIVRRIVGGGLRVQLPFAALCGGILVVLSDLLGRVLFAPWEIPAGILMALIGAPFFLYLLLRKRRNYD